MSHRIFALLVGINDYTQPVSKLYGCVNDVDNLQNYLLTTFDRAHLHLEVLLDADATRTNIIDQFRKHLCKAGKDDIVLFHYSGHGARWTSASPFVKFYPDGKDEGLVCYDSRTSDGFDLADKELAVLLAEVSKNDPHITVVLDCCHSGSATRTADDFTQLRARQTNEIPAERPLDSYLNGYYSKRHERGESLEIPASRHILLAACQRFQKAWEGMDRSGVFTSTLLDVLNRSGHYISYADLFTRCRAAVLKRADNQDPQFETYGGFNAYCRFLSSANLQDPARRYSVYFDSGHWRTDCGALHGLPSNPEKKVEMAIYEESVPTTLIGHATVSRVGAQKSELKMLDVDVHARYQSEITSLPVPPLPIGLEGDAEGVGAFQTFMFESNDEACGVSLETDSLDGVRYTLVAEAGRFLLKVRESGKLIQGSSGYERESAGFMLSVLKRVGDWERAVQLQNQSTNLNVDDVSFRYFENVNGQQHEYQSDEVTLEITDDYGQDASNPITGELKVDNRTNQTLHMMLVLLSEDFGITVVYNERVATTNQLFTLTPMGQSSVNFFLDETEGNEKNYTFKLVVSTEKVDDFLIGQEPFEVGNIYSRRRGDPVRGASFGTPPQKKIVYQNEWFCKDIRFKLVRRLDRVSESDLTLASGQIKISGHPSLQASISLVGNAGTAVRGVGASSGVFRYLERQGLELLSFNHSRGGNETVLEFTDIQNADALEQDPLELTLDIDLAEDEFILPLTFDGEHILLAGEPSLDNDGRAHINIDHVPDIPSNRRSLGKALKLYFLKTYLRRRNVNQLRWVEFMEDGSIVRHADGVADKVASAKNVLLLIHGIIGDTKGIAEGLRLANDIDGQSVNQKFDLVLTYDYENLSTPISTTASQMKQQLKDAGIDENDHIRLTLVVHSMGGLVARWWVEREGGNQVVNHLVMFGTPNIGSPFGKVDAARGIAKLLTTLAINTVPACVPLGGALLYLLNRSQNLTPTLEQMNPDSDFIKMLNASDDPGVRYTVVAGDIRNYQEESDKGLQRLIAKIGGGAMFDLLYQNAAHDIAVSDFSIRGVDDSRSPQPRELGVVCHHLNYFVSEAGLDALAAMKW